MRSSSTALLALPLAALLAGGCPQVVDVVQDLLPGTPAISPIGTTKSDLLLSKLDGPSLQSTRTVCAIDVETGVSREIAGGISAVTGQMAANESYIAWLDIGGSVVQVFQRSSGQTATVFTALTGELNVRAVLGDMLILHRSTGGLLNPRWEFRLINLATTADSTISTSWQFGTFAYDGRWFALLNDENVTADPNSLELIANLDLVDTDTGTRNRIADNIRVRGDGGSLFLDGDRLIWEQFGPDFSNRVLAYDLDTGSIETLSENFDGEIQAVQDGRFLSLDTNGNPLLLETQAIQLGGLDQNTRLVTYSFTLNDSQVFDLLPQLVGDTAVWIDPFTGEILTLNPTTGDSARITP